MRTIHYRGADQSTALLQGFNVPLGVLHSEVYAQTRVTIGDNDILVFYSDGVTEVRNAQGEFFGLERIEALVKERADTPAQELAQDICNAAIAFAGSSGLPDDLTCLVVRIASGADGRPIAHASMEVHSTPRELDALRRLVEWFCRERAEPRLSEADTSALVLAVSEAASNVLEHAYWGARARRLQVVATAFPGEGRLELSAWGQAFDPTAVAPPSFDGSRDGGFGVCIITQCVDECNYFRDDLGRNCLRLVKRASSAPSEA